MEEENQKGLFDKVEELTQQAIREAIEPANELIKKAGEVCNDEGQCLKPIELAKRK